MKLDSTSIDISSHLRDAVGNEAAAEHVTETRLSTSPPVKSLKRLSGTDRQAKVHARFVAKEAAKKENEAAIVAQQEDARKKAADETTKWEQEYYTHVSTCQSFASGDKAVTVVKVATRM